MMKYFPFLIICLITVQSWAQDATIQGSVFEKDTKAPLIGAPVIESAQNGVVTDEKGNYKILVKAGIVKVTYSYTGMEKETKTFQLRAGEIRTENISLTSNTNQVGEVTISVGRMEKKITETPVTVEVFKPRIIENNNITNLQQVINKVPGVTIMDGSVSIRGGSGYAYGSGSRVMMVVDEMPLITPDRAEIRWEFVPLENISQVEVMKGASSVQYGSSALNGVIQVTTANPTETPVTKAQFYTEIYDNPRTPSFKWWGAKNNMSYLNSPHVNGATFMHSRKFKSGVSIVVGANLHESKSHLSDEFDNRIRLNAKIKYTPVKFNRITFGLGANVLIRKQGFQFFWQDSSNQYKSAPGVTIQENFIYTMIDPSIHFIDKSNSQHRLLGRWYNQNNPQNKDSPHFNQFNLDYQFRHDFGKLAKIVVGVNNMYYKVVDGVLGIHHGNQGGGYAQGELNYKGLNINVGGRLEYLNLDSITRLTKPVFKAGMTYKFKTNNHFRFGWGQAYRFGSIAERFVLYQLSNINILPNPTIIPERGWTAELGYKRGFKMGRNWRGYADACFFMSHFNNMIEFQLQYATVNPDQSIQAFFQSKNVTKAQIFGWELALNGEGKIGPVDLTFQAGYTYFYPKNMSDTTANNSMGSFLKESFSNFVKTDSASVSHMLKYRNRHQFKFDIDAVIYKKIKLGTSFNFYSFMDAVDPIFEYAIKDIKAWRTKNQGKPDWVWDVRGGVQISKNVSINLVVRNILNNNYSIRIAKPNAPRSFAIQLYTQF